MLSILGFLAVLGPLVIFHEFGHYIFARMFNVKAEVFSIGFGPRIWSKQLGETELRLAAIPLGGFVKLLGEEPDRELTEEEAARSLNRQAAWKRFLIFFAGPLFNFILAIVVFAAIMLIGEPQMASVIGRVVEGSHAQQIGLQSGDRVTAIDGKPVKLYEEVATAIGESPKKPLAFTVERAHSGIIETLSVSPLSEKGYSVYGEQTSVGEVEGMLPMGRATQVGISESDSLAAKQGVRTGDRIVSLNGQPVASWEELTYQYQSLPAASSVVLKFEAKGSEPPKSVSFLKSQAGLTLAAATGLRSSELFIDKVVPESPAAKAGLKSGDRLIAVDGTEMRSFFELRDSIQHSGEKTGKVAITWERFGQEPASHPVTTTIVPTSTTVKDPLLNKSTQFTIGVMPQLVWSEPVTIIERVVNPFTLLYKATERTVVFSYRNLVSIGKMFKGEVSLATLGGPILIGKIAGESISRGLIAFLTTMAVLSVGLGVLNLLPIPVLDGGHLLLLVIESIRGKPLSMRQMEIVQQVGLSLILLLMVVVMRNDLSRLPFFD